MKIPAALKGTAATYAALGVGALVLIYVAIKYGPKLAQSATNAAGQTVGGAVQGAISGLDNNALTNTQGLAPNQQPTDGQGFGGDLNYNYSGYGALATPAAAANKLTGGGLAALGETIGGWFADAFGPSYDPNSGTAQSAATRDQVVTPNYVTDISATTGQPSGASGSW